MACKTRLSEGSHDLARASAAPVDLARATASPDLAHVCPGDCPTADPATIQAGATCGVARAAGKICNCGDVPGAFVATFYYSQGGSTLPPFDRSTATPLCTITTATLAPGACAEVSCDITAWTHGGNPPDGDYWLRANDDGQTFPLAAECRTDDDLAGEWIDCTLAMMRRNLVCLKRHS